MFLRVNDVYHAMENVLNITVVSGNITSYQIVGGTATPVGSNIVQLGNWSQGGYFNKTLDSQV